MTGRQDAVVVLGCRVVGGRPSPTMQGRLSRAAELSRAHPHLAIIMSGGKRWEGRTEAAVMQDWWHEQGPSDCTVLLEERSLTTRQNARFSARLCESRGYRRIVLVTCDYHMPRAKSLFQKQQLEVIPAPVTTAHRNIRRVRVLSREWGARLLGRLSSWTR